MYFIFIFKTFKYKRIVLKEDSDIPLRQQRYNLINIHLSGTSSLNKDHD